MTVALSGSVAAGWWQSFLSFAQPLEDLILSLTESPWIYPAITAVTIIDGIFPPVPSESIVIAAATTWAQDGRPLIWAVWIAAALGAWTGDQIAYSLGRAIHVRAIPGLRGQKGLATLDWAERALEHRGTSFIIAARFIPVGRVAVNLTAGALRFPRRRFMGVDALAATIWATYSVALGIFAGSLLDNSLLVSIAIGVVGGIALGYLVDAVLRRFGVKPPDLPRAEELPGTTRARRRRDPGAPTAS